MPDETRQALPDQGARQIVCIECAEAGINQPVTRRGGAWMCPVHRDRGHIQMQTPPAERDQTHEAFVKLASLVLTDHEAGERGYLHFNTEYEGVIRDRASVAHRLLEELGIDPPGSPYRPREDDGAYKWLSAERDRLRVEVEALKAAKDEWVAGYGDGLGDSRTEIAALKAERDRLRAENEALKEQARVACRQAIELDKANGALLQALEQAWVSAHENHRAIKRRDVDCTMRPCPQIRAAVASDEQEGTT